MISPTQNNVSYPTHVVIGQAVIFILEFGGAAGLSDTFLIFLFLLKKKNRAGGNDSTL